LNFGGKGLAGGGGGLAPAGLPPSHGSHCGWTRPPRRDGCELVIHLPRQVRKLNFVVGRCQHEGHVGSVRMSTRIGDYALIGDCETAALVHRDGSIDWLCWPRFDSPACFSALLGTAEHGSWRMQAEDEVHTRARRYRPDTLILETDIETADGACTVVDFMPMRKAQSDLVRIVVGRRGCVRLRSDIALRFDYGRLVPWVKRLPEGFDAISGPDAVTAALPVESSVSDGKICSRFDVHEGERLHFVLTYRRSHLQPASRESGSGGLGAQVGRRWRAARYPTAPALL